MKNVDMDKIYRDLPLDQIPWNMETPPETLVELVNSGKIEPCRAVDLGCGIGNYAIYLATRGFNVTGIDISPTAINLARENAARKGAKCDFLVADLLGDIEEMKETFEFAYDWEVLHHIFPETRKKYVENVHKLLSPGGKYLSVCFSEENPQFGGSGKVRETPLGTVLYFSSEAELNDLFEPYFHVEEIKTMQIKGKYSPHLVIYAFLERL